MSMNMPNQRLEAPRQARTRLRNLVANRSECFQHLRSLEERVKAAHERIKEVRLDVERHAEYVGRFDWSYTANPQADRRWPDYERSKRIVDVGKEEIEALEEDKKALEEQKDEWLQLAPQFPSDELLRYLNVTESTLGAIGCDCRTSPTPTRWRSRRSAIAWQRSWPNSLQ